MESEVVFVLSSSWANLESNIALNQPLLTLLWMRYQLQLGIPFPYSCEWMVVAQSCWTLCNPTDCHLPGSSVHGILQARILEWVDISFSRHALVIILYIVSKDQHTLSCSLMSFQKAESHISGALALPNPWFKVLRYSDKSISHQVNLKTTHT